MAPFVPQVSEQAWGTLSPMTQPGYFSYGACACVGLGWDMLSPRPMTARQVEYAAQSEASMLAWKIASESERHETLSTIKVPISRCWHAFGDLGRGRSWYLAPQVMLQTQQLNIRAKSGQTGRLDLHITSIPWHSLQDAHQLIQQRHVLFYLSAAGCTRPRAPVLQAARASAEC
eukprot:210390-Pelagomonas_calceolata.AAC.14